MVCYPFSAVKPTSSKSLGMTRGDPPEHVKAETPPPLSLQAAIPVISLSSDSIHRLHFPQIRQRLPLWLFGCAVEEGRSRLRGWVPGIPRG